MRTTEQVTYSWPILVVANVGVHVCRALKLLPWVYIELLMYFISCHLWILGEFIKKNNYVSHKALVGFLSEQVDNSWKMCRNTFCSFSVLKVEGQPTFSDFKANAITSNIWFVLHLLKKQQANKKNYLLVRH